jgi:hypothetical protein
MGYSEMERINGWALIFCRLFFNIHFKMNTSRKLSSSSSSENSESGEIPGVSRGTSPNLEAETERLRALLVKTGTPEDLRKILLLNRDSLDRIPVALLNSWLVSLPSLRFYKNHGYLALRKTEGKADRETEIIKRISSLEKRMEELAKITNMNTGKLREVIAFLSENEREA